MVERLQAAWDRHFFSPTPASALASFRIAFYLAALAHELYHFRLRYYCFPPYLFKADGIFLLFPVPQPGLEVIYLLYALLAFALLLSALGFGPGVRLAAALLAAYIYGIRYNYGFNFKAEGGVSVLLFLMAFSRCDEVLAVRPSADKPPCDSGDYRWPIQFARTYWIYMLFTAGLFKLKYTGWQWAYGDSIHFVLLRQMYYLYPHEHPPSEIGRFLLNHPWLTWLGSWNTLLAELMSPLMFWPGRVRFLVLGNLLVMLVIVRFSMDHSFFIAHLPLYVSLLPWETWGPRWRKDAA